MMPDKHFYFSIGATLGSVASMYLVNAQTQLEKRIALIRKLAQWQPHWPLYFPGIIFVAGLWGLVPDILHALNIFPKEFTRSELFNLFFGHSYFESVEDTYPDVDRWLNWTGEALLFIIVLGSMSYYVRTINKSVGRKE